MITTGLNLPDISEKPVTLQSILYEVCKERKVSVTEVKSRSQKMHLVEARRDFVLRAKAQDGFRPAEIMKTINRTSTTFYNY